MSKTESYGTPPKALPPPTGRRTRSLSSSSSISISPTPSPSHAHCRLSVIPFSWELQPGVPKTSPKIFRSAPRVACLVLPLPPPLRSVSDSSISRRQRSDSRSSSDPFAAALEECSRDRPAAGDEELEEFWRNGMRAARGRRRTPVAGRIAIADLYGSCMAACSVADSTVRIQRSGHPVGSYDLLLNRRAG